MLVDSKAVSTVFPTVERMVERKVESYADATVSLLADQMVETMDAQSVGTMVG